MPYPQDLRHFEAGEFDSITRYLGLPDTPARLLEAPLLTVLAKKWASHPNVRAVLSPAAAAACGAVLSGPVSYPHRVGSLVELPQGGNSIA